MQVLIEGDNSWIIVREYVNGDIILYSITDSPKIKEFIKWWNGSSCSPLELQSRTYMKSRFNAANIGEITVALHPHWCGATFFWCGEEAVPVPLLIEYRADAKPRDVLPGNSVKIDSIGDVFLCKRRKFRTNLHFSCTLFVFFEKSCIFAGVMHNLPVR